MEELRLAMLCFIQVKIFNKKTKLFWEFMWIMVFVCIPCRGQLSQPTLVFLMHHETQVGRLHTSVLVTNTADFQAMWQWNYL